MQSYNFSLAANASIYYEIVALLRDVNSGSYHWTWAITIPFTVLETLAKDGRVMDANELLVGAKNNAPIMNVVDYSVIIDVLRKEGHVDKALDLCSFAKYKWIALNIITYNSVIKGLCRQGCLVEAFRLFLEKIGVVPSEITYGTLIDALTKEGIGTSFCDFLNLIRLEPLRKLWVQ
ncbi:unnamed protein product [Fraxinus pennsylvanica]|uniref:Pentatricopeptide repeat-containing protein n=1 Tax=Fraxinus pennsylvanica TaxID=56036 RepID=A0AAD2DKA3_9LAMI|nr:unnamed protein product [Fraxinus pennsylvanica]